MHGSTLMKTNAKVGIKSDRSGRDYLHMRIDSENIRTKLPRPTEIRDGFAHYTVNTDKLKAA